MSKASRERERIRNEKHGFKKESIVAQACKIWRSDKTVDEKLEMLNNFTLDICGNDLEPLLKDKKKCEEFVAQFDISRFIGLVNPFVSEDKNYLTVRGIGIDDEFFPLVQNVTSKDEYDKLYEEHKIEFNFVVKTPLGIISALINLGKIGEDFINNIEKYS